MRAFILLLFLPSIGIPNLMPQVAIAEDGMSAALEQLKSIEPSVTSQSEIQEAWSIVSKGDVDSLIPVLEAMKETGPLSENWLRIAFDSIADREIKSGKTLPLSSLEGFLNDTEHSPRARRTAYELIVKLDKSATERLLPNFLNDPSLELRFDAIKQALTEAKNASEQAEKLNLYRRALKYARDEGQVREAIDALKELDAAPDLPKTFGYITSWKVIGPFDNENGKGFDRAYGPETAVDLSKEFEGLEGTVSWKDHEADSSRIDKVALVNLNKALVEKKSVVGYALANFVSNVAKKVELRYASKNATKVFVNGKIVASKQIYHSGAFFDQYIVPIELKKGENLIMVKLCQNAQTQPWARVWEFQMRVSDELGGAILSQE